MIPTPVVRQNLLAIEALQKTVEDLKERILLLEEKLLETAAGRSTGSSDCNDTREEGGAS